MNTLAFDNGSSLQFLTSPSPYEFMLTGASKPTKLHRPETWEQYMQANRDNMVEQQLQVWRGYAVATVKTTVGQFHKAFPFNERLDQILAARGVRARFYSRSIGQRYHNEVILHFDSDEDAIHFKLKHL